MSWRRWSFVGGIVVAVVVMVAAIGWGRDHADGAPVGGGGSSATQAAGDAFASIGKAVEATACPA